MEYDSYYISSLLPLLVDKMCIRQKGINVVNAGRYRKSKSETQYYAGKEVILCGGAFNTPQAGFQNDALKSF